MKQDLLHTGVEATENKHMTISDLKTGIIVVLTLITSILLCVTFTQIYRVSQYKAKIEAQNEIIAIQQSTINELTHDNLNLVNNK
jgi:hypothetical protein